MRVDSIVVSRGLHNNNDGTVDLLGVSQSVCVDQIPGDTPALYLTLSGALAGDEDRTIRTRFAVLDPDGHELDLGYGEHSHTIAKGRGDSVGLGIHFLPFPIARAGTYVLALYINGDLAKSIDVEFYEGPPRSFSRTHSDARER